MIEFLIIFAALVVGHFLADYPLQGDFLARAKNRFAPIPGVPWYQALAAHSIIHGGMVAVILAVFGVPAIIAFVLGLSESCIHALIDDTKCRGDIDFDFDQILHLSFKAAWALIFVIIF